MRGTQNIFVTFRQWDSDLVLTDSRFFQSSFSMKKFFMSLLAVSFNICAAWRCLLTNSAYP